MSSKELKNIDIPSMEINKDSSCITKTNNEAPIHIQEEILISSGSRDPGKVGVVYLHGQQIVSLTMEGKERLCLAQISNTLLKNFSYNEIHNRRVALGITCVQCTPVQLEILRKAGAMPSSSRRCGMITKREAERLVHSFLDDVVPPKLPDDFVFRVEHDCGWGCKGAFVPSRYNSSRAKCIRCYLCGVFFSPNKFIFHFHRSTQSKYNHPDAANFNSWRRHLKLSDERKQNELVLNAWEDVKAMFNGGNRRRMHSSHQRNLHNSQQSHPPTHEDSRSEPPSEKLKSSLSYPEMLQHDKDVQIHPLQSQENVNSLNTESSLQSTFRYPHFRNSYPSVSHTSQAMQSLYSDGVRFNHHSTTTPSLQANFERGNSPCLARNCFIPNVSFSSSSVVCSLLPTGQSYGPHSRNFKEFTNFPHLLNNKPPLESSTFNFPFYNPPVEGPISSYCHQGLIQPHPFFPRHRLEAGYPRIDLSLWHASKFRFHNILTDSISTHQSVLAPSSNLNLESTSFSGNKIHGFPERRFEKNSESGQSFVSSHIVPFEEETFENPKHFTDHSIDNVKTVSSEENQLQTAKPCCLSIFPMDGVGIFGNNNSVHNHNAGFSLSKEEPSDPTRVSANLSASFEIRQAQKQSLINSLLTRQRTNVSHNFHRSETNEAIMNQNNIPIHNFVHDCDNTNIKRFQNPVEPEVQYQLVDRSLRNKHSELYETHQNIREKTKELFSKEVSFESTHQGLSTNVKDNYSCHGGNANKNYLNKKDFSLASILRTSTPDSEESNVLIKSENLDDTCAITES